VKAKQTGKPLNPYPIPTVVTFTFNLLDRFGVLERAYVHISNVVNKNILARNTLNTELIADVFKSVDGFWLKYGRTTKYNESEIRVIIGSVAESLRDNQLDSKEVRAIVNYVVAKWKPEVAQSKASLDTAVLLPSTVENNALRAVEVYSQVDTGKVSAVDFVALGSRAIAENLPDNKIVSGVMSALNLFK
jgi:hypothetical protein